VRAHEVLHGDEGSELVVDSIVLHDGELVGEAAGRGKEKENTSGSALRRKLVET